ncbi:hypothetical protein MKW98_001086 [Papaver atlanticum]|uniref:Uncharacterized protein n=1 Tax=Papaver atlanticum TaxID=357466 RepID=A0AAD4XJX0_9MAGN|nr:hypothetical protein MKW98_001086 [Papaver atlanticum]
MFTKILNFLYCLHAYEFQKTNYVCQLTHDTGHCCNDSGRVIIISEANLILGCYQPLLHSRLGIMNLKPGIMENSMKNAARIA